MSKKHSKRNTISLEKKIEILDKLQTGLGSTAVAKHFGLSEATVRSIKKCEEKIRERVGTGYSLNLKYASYFQNKTIQKMEEILIVWVKDNIQNDNPASGNDIRQKALEIYNDIKLRYSSSSNQAIQFLGSKGWLENFKKRYCLHKFRRKKRTKTKSINDNMVADYPEMQEDIIIKPSNSPDEELNINKTNFSPICSESNNSDCKKQISKLTPNIIAKGILMANELEAFFLKHDPNSERSLKFGRELRNCLVPYLNLSEDLCKNDEFIPSSLNVT